MASPSNATNGHSARWAPTPEDAAAFAASWYAAWNAHDLDGIMSHYAPTIQHSSPFIKRYNNSDDLALIGIDAVRDYFARALQRNPTLRFDPMFVTTGLESVNLVYRRMSGDLAAEVFFLIKPTGTSRPLIVRSVSHYG